MVLAQIKNSDPSANFDFWQLIVSNHIYRYCGKENAKVEYPRRDHQDEKIGIHDGTSTKRFDNANDLRVIFSYLPSKSVSPEGRRWVFLSDIK